MVHKRFSFPSECFVMHFIINQSFTIKPKWSIETKSPNIVLPPLIKTKVVVQLKSCPRGLGLSPTLGFLLSGKPVSPSPSPAPPAVLSLYLCQLFFLKNWYEKQNK